jgi:hypothetical protein
MIVVSLMLCVLSILGNPSYAQPQPPRIPYIQHNVCPFECCQYGRWTAKSLLSTYQIEGDDSTVAFMIKPGEQFTTTGGNVHIMKLGEIVLNRSFDEFTRGDKVYILSYRGEGVYDLWYKGKILDSSEKVWLNSVLMGWPEFEWWALIKNRAGKQGWLRLKNVSRTGFQIEYEIDGMDSCS